MLNKEVLKQFNIDAIYCIDFETYYDSKDYSLRKMATTEYVFDERFKTHMVAVQKTNWSSARIMSPVQFKAWARTINWKRAGMLAHHAHFDGLIASKYFKVNPAAYLDTLSMSRPIMPVTVGGSLKELCAAFGREAKKDGAVLVDTDGKRELTKAEYKRMSAYAGGDTEDTLFLFNEFIKYTQPTEMRLIDITVKMYAQPRLLIDTKMIDKLHTETVDGKADHLVSLTKIFGRKLDKKEIVSNDQFADLMREIGYEPPEKTSPSTGKLTYALAKGDQDFKDLLSHEDIQLRTLVAARMALKTSILETRTKRMSNRSAHGVQPIYLNYWKAKTGRWTGGDKSNWQNLTRGSDMRKAIYAPEGYKLIIADLGQIEVRVNAWVAWQKDLLEVFASGGDPYCHAASKLYNRHIPAPVDDEPYEFKDERFVGKVATLMLGYGAGGPKFAAYMRLGGMGKAVDMSDDEGKDIVNKWRATNNKIVANWKHVQSVARSAFAGKQEFADELLTYIGYEGRGITVLPDNTYIRYDGIVFDEEGMSYCTTARKLRNGGVNKVMQRLYGGLLVENNTQALARSIIGHQMVEIADALPYGQIVMSTHDEIVTIVPVKKAELALKKISKIMTTPPLWAPTMPLAVDAHISQRYDK